MPIPNLSTLYQRIHSGSEGGNEFARFIRLLLQADFASLGVNFISESDASGDFKKVDAYVPGKKEFKNCIVGFQFKFYPYKLSSGQKSEIIKSIEDALEENELIQDFILVTPEDWQKEQLAWFDGLKKRFETVYWASNEDISMKCHFRLAHWGHSKIIELALKHDHIGQHYFPELFPLGVGKFKLAKATIDPKLCVFVPFKEGGHSFYMEKSNTSITTDPVFDFQFKNSTQEIRLLNRIEVHIEEIWSTLKGLPAEDLLKSIGVIQIRLDFKKTVNVYDLDDPLIIEAGKPKRFNVQLTDFGRCPGNNIRLKFWFHFDDISIPTNTFTLGL